MQLDIRTLTFTLQLFALVFAVGMFLVQRGQPAMRGLIWWAAAYAAAGLGFLLLALRGAIPDFVSVVVASALLLASLCFFREGAVRFRRQPRRLPWLGAALLALLVPTLMYYLYVVPNVANRVVAVTLTNAIPAALTAWLLAKDVPIRLRTSHWFTAAAFGQMVIVSAVRVAHTLLHPPDNLMTAGPVHAMYLLSVLLLLVMSIFGCIWMLTMHQEIELERQARTDPLTGAMNRLALAESITRELARAQRNGRPLSVLMFDLDFFKQLNDRLGHQAGDAALKNVAAATQRHLRASDLLARYGGEEFVAVLPDTDKARAVETAERLRQEIESLGIPCGNGTALTASYGAATYPADGDDFDSLVASADAALYKAKQSGRNRVVAA
jgi:diguanylate cyclase (GGDEF)-like protein